MYFLQGNNNQQWSEDNKQAFSNWLLILFPNQIYGDCLSTSMINTVNNNDYSVFNSVHMMVMVMDCYDGIL